MGTHDEMRKQVKRKFGRPAGKEHEECVKALEEAKEIVGQLEKRLEASFANIRELEEREEAWKDERNELRDKLKKLEEEVKHERRRATQALDVAEGASAAVSGVGRLLHSLVDHEVLETLRLENDRRQREHQDRMRHRGSV